MNYETKSVLGISSPQTSPAASMGTRQYPPLAVCGASKARGRQPNSPKRRFTLAWAAGFADGESSICIVKQTYKAIQKRSLSYRLTFSITQNDLQVLEHFSEGLRGLGVAGGIYKVKRLIGHNKQVYTLNYSGVHALKVIARLKRHLIRKQLEAKTAMAYWKQAKGGKRPGPRGWPPSVIATRERFYLKLKSLK
jgi:hypothetical protein